MILRITASILFSLITGMQPSLQASQEGQLLPATRIEGYGVIGLIQNLGIKANTPVGVESFEFFNQEKPLVLEFKGGTLRKALEQIVSEKQNYSIQATAAQHLEIVDLNSIGPGGIILDYEGVTAANRKTVYESLEHQLPLTRWLQEHGCEREQFMNGKEWRGATNSITISPGRIALRDLLDQASSQSDTKRWSIIRSESGSRCKITIVLF